VPHRRGTLLYVEKDLLRQHRIAIAHGIHTQRRHAVNR
jgi:hypothetical protein